MLHHFRRLIYKPIRWTHSSPFCIKQQQQQQQQQQPQASSGNQQGFGYPTGHSHQALPDTNQPARRKWSANPQENPSTSAATSTPSEPQKNPPTFRYAACWGRTRSRFKNAGRARWIMILCDKAVSETGGYRRWRLLLFIFFVGGGSL